MEATRRCPRCHEGVLRSWAELNEEERELVKRLPASAEYPAAKRERTHRWCSRCWHETNETEEKA